MILPALVTAALLLGGHPAPTKTIVFHDDFTGTTIGSVWQTRGTDYEIGSTFARGSAAAADVSKGFLHLRVLPDPSNPGHYLNGHLGTEGRFEFARGWVAARIKVPPYTGAHAAFWILTPTITGDIAGHEVDVMESFGASRPNAPRGTNVWHGVWYPDPTQLPVGFPFIQTHDAVNSLDFGTQPWHRAFHTYAVHWTPTRYSFYIDGIRVGVIRVGLTGTPKFLVLSLLSRDWEIPALRTHSLSTYVMKVDWIRVWTQA